MISYLRKSVFGQLVILSIVGGCVDAIGFIALGKLFVSHMSGNSTFLGLWLGQGDWLSAGFRFFDILLFIAGITIGHILISSNNFHYSSVLLLEAGLLAGFAVALFLLGKSSQSLFYLGIFALPLIAMGLQNSTINKFCKNTFHTTYMTGVLDTIGASLAKFLMWLWRRRSSTEIQSIFCQNDFIISIRALRIWLAYVFGAAIGCFGLLSTPGWIAFFPPVLLAGVAFLSWPRALETKE